MSLGCATDPRDVVDYSTEPIGMQLLRIEPMLKGRRFNTLLSFESPDDLVFLASKPDAQQTGRRAHTGRHSATVGTEVRVNLASLMAGRAFPGNWTLVGGYLWSDRPAQIEMRCTVGGSETKRTLELPAGKWTPGFVDLTQLNPPVETSASDAVLTIQSSQPMLCDDVMILENTEWFVGGEDSPWVIRQRGFKIMIEREKWFTIALDTVDMSRSGWEVEEVSPMRAIFRSEGKTKHLTIYSDGRTYWDGRFEPLSGSAKSDPLLASGHERPGLITVAEGAGRTNRNTPGDHDNDGYNEDLGAYEATASGPRTEITLSPRGVPLVRPIVELAGLPEGKVLITLEGRLVESFIRLKNGNVLIEVPARIERATTLNVNVDDASAG